MYNGVKIATFLKKKNIEKKKKLKSQKYFRLFTTLTFCHMLILLNMDIDLNEYIKLNTICLIFFTFLLTKI